MATSDNPGSTFAQALAAMARDAGGRASSLLSAPRLPGPARALGLRPPLNRYGQRLGIPVRLPGGLTLRADHFWPAAPSGRPMDAATILIRTPYYRQSSFDARLLARQGFHVLVVSSRGRFGSEGEFDQPMLFEAEDGQQVVAWLRRQPYFNGELITWGQSYLGYTQWALAVDPPPELRAMVVRIGPHRFVEAAYPGGAPAAGTMLYWAGLIHSQESRSFSRYLLDAALSRGTDLGRAVGSWPLLDNYPIATGAKLPFFEDWITSPPASPYWELSDDTEALRRINVPVLLQTGWFDLFLSYTLEQYETLSSRGVDVQLTIGPWAHSDPALMVGDSFAEGVAWLRDALGTGTRLRHRPVRIAVTGSKRWRLLPAWPPPSGERSWWLAPDGALAPSPPTEPEEPDTYLFDPLSPPPAVGGSGLTGSLGAADNRALESRDDVLTFTSEPLSAPLDIAGKVRAEIYVGSSRPTADFFVRLTDVSPRVGPERSGASINVCDGIRRLAPMPGQRETGSWLLQVTLGDIAHHFAPGHRIRLQVSSGAAPRYQPNPGVLEAIEAPATAEAAFAAQQEVRHGSAFPSRVILPVVTDWPA